MDPRKNALQEFFDNSKEILQYHLTNAINTGKVKKDESDELLNTFDDRVDIILNAYDKELKKQEGGGLLDKAQGAMASGQSAMASMEKYSPEQIQKNIDKLLSFSPKNALPNTVEPIVEQNLWIFVPQVRETVKQILGSIFLIGGLEKMPIFGPIVGAAMDITTAYLPALAVTVQNMLPNLIGLAPIPYAAFAGEAAGYAVSAVMMLFTLMTQLSRGEFSEAVEAGAGLIPVVGTTLMSYVGKAKKLYGKYEERRAQIMVSLAQIQGLMMYLIPMAGKQSKKILEKVLPIFKVFFKQASQYMSKFTPYIQAPANMVIDNLKPIVQAAKNRLTKRYSVETQKGGRKKRKGLKKHKTRRSKENKH